MLEQLISFNSTGKPLDEMVRLPDGRIVRRYTCGDHESIYYEVYRQVDLYEAKGHRYYTIGYGWLEDVTTVALPAEIEALPYHSRERWDAALVFYRSLKQEAERIVRETFPQDFANAQK